MSLANLRRDKVNFLLFILRDSIIVQGLKLGRQFHKLCGLLIMNFDHKLFLSIFSLYKEFAITYF